MTDSLTRCFIAIEIPASIHRNISEYIIKLEPFSKGIRWVRPQAIHLTLKFLGEIEKNKLDKIRQSLFEVTGQLSPFELTITDAGCFPNKQHPRVFWLGLDMGPENELSLLHAWIEEALEKIGFEKEKRKFSPHLTFGRVKQSKNYSALFEFINENPFEAKSFNVNKIDLIKSDLKQTGAIYTTLQSCPL